MSEKVVKRYDPNYSVMSASDDSMVPGSEFVSSEDYDALQSRLDAAEALAEVGSTGADKAAKAMLYWKRDADALRQQLAERDAVLRQLRGMINCTPENDIEQTPVWISTKHPVIERIDALLSSAEPVKCHNCDGHGVVGWTTGQTAESFDQGEALCPECEGAGETAKGGDGEVALSGNISDQDWINAGCPRENDDD